MAEYDGEITLSVNLDAKQVTQKAKELSNQLSNMFNDESVDRNSKAFQRWQIQVDRALTASRELTAQLNQLEGQKIPTEQYTNLQKQIEKAETALERLYTRREAYEELGKQAPQRLVNQIKAAEEQLARLESGMQQLVAEGKDFTLGKDTDEFQNLQNKLNGINNQMVLLRQSAPQIVSEQPVQKANDLHRSFQRAYSVALKLAYTLGTTIKSGITRLIELNKKMFTSSKSGMKSMDVNWSKLIKKVLAYGFGIRSLYRLFSIIRNNIKQGFNNLVQFNDGANSTNKAMSRLYSSAMQLRNALGSMVAPIVEALTPALDLLINKLTSALNTLGMFIAKLTGKSTYLQATKLTLDYAKAVDKASKSKDKDNKNTNKQLASYDKLNNMSEDAIKKAMGEKEEDQLDPNKMFKEVEIPSAFDDWVNKFKKWWEDADFTELGRLLGNKLKEALESIDWDSIQETAEKIGKSLATFINGFVETEDLGYTIGYTLGEAINTGILGINAFLDNTHWDSVGKFIGDGINGMIDSIQWDALGHMFAMKYNAIFDVIGGFAETVHWEDLGDALTQGINTFIEDVKWEENGQHLGELFTGVMQTLNVVLEEVDWNGLGEGIAENFNGIFEKTDPDEAGRLLGNAVNAVVGIAQGMLDTTKWEEIGKWFAQGINKATDTIRWDDIGHMLSTGLNSLVDTVDAFAKNIDLKSLGEGISSGLQTAVEEVDVKKIFETISDTLIACIDGLTGVVEGIRWQDLAETIWDWFIDVFTGIKWAQITEKLAHLIGSCVGGVAAFGVGIIKKMKEAAKNIWEDVKKWFEEHAMENGKFTLSGFLNGIVEAIIGIGTWIKEHVVDPFIEGFKNAFEIHSPSKVMEEIGGFIIEGLLAPFDGLKEIIDKIIQFKDDVMSHLNTMVVDVVAKMDEMGIDVFDIWGSLGDKLKGVFNDILAGIEGFVNGGIDGINGLVDALNSFSIDVPDWVTDMTGMDSFGFNVPYLNNISLPRLAQGAVLPANKPFLAVLGDQKQGTNVETPLSTMVEAMVQALTQTGLANNDNKDVVIQIDGREIARATRRQDQIFKQSTGHSMFAY